MKVSPHNKFAAPVLGIIVVIVSLILVCYLPVIAALIFLLFCLIALVINWQALGKFAAIKRFLWLLLTDW